MKKLCLLSVLLFLTLLSPAQLKKGYIYLKNGTILKGKFLESGDPQKYKIESAGNIWVFNTGEVDTIMASKQITRIPQEKTVKSRFSNLSEMGILVGNSNNSQSAPLSFNSFLNYQFRSHMIAGLGSGVEFLKETYVPALVNLQYRLRNTYSTPYLFFEGGYQIPVEDSHYVYYDVYPVYTTSRFWPYPYPNNANLKAKGGFLLNPGIGFIQMFSSNFGMSISFGYRFNRLNYSGDKDYELDLNYNRLSVKLGFIFN